MFLHFLSWLSHHSSRNQGCIDPSRWWKGGKMKRKIWADDCKTWEKAYWYEVHYIILIWSQPFLKGSPFMARYGLALQLGQSFVLYFKMKRVNFGKVHRLPNTSLSHVLQVLKIDIWAWMKYGSQACTYQPSLHFITTQDISYSEF